MLRSVPSKQSIQYILNYSALQKLITFANHFCTYSYIYVKNEHILTHMLKTTCVIITKTMTITDPDGNFNLGENKTTSSNLKDK